MHAERYDSVVVFKYPRRTISLSQTQHFIQEPALLFHIMFNFGKRIWEHMVSQHEKTLQNN